MKHYSQFLFSAIRLRSAFVAVSVLICIQLLSIKVVIAASPVTQYPVKLLWFYKPPKDGTSIESVQRWFNDDIILTKNDEAERDKLIQLGVSQPILQYLRSEAIHAPCNGACPCDHQPNRNQVAWKIGDYCSILADHPDWFLTDNNGNILFRHEGNQRYVYMDMGRRGWQQFWLDRARQSQEQDGWDGVFLDNVQASLRKLKRYNSIPERYPNDASWQSAVESFLSYIYTNYFQPQNRPLQANIIEIRDNDVWFSYLENLDGALREDFAVGWHSGDYRSTEEWEEHLDLAEQTQALGKHIKLVSQGDKTDWNRFRFAFASYLLVAKGRASFRYGYAPNYREMWTYSKYRMDIGAPIGSRYLDGDVWRRDFQNGRVSVYPNRHVWFEW